MASYTVLSDNFTVGEKGTVLTEAQLAGCNIAALIEGGTLSSEGAPPAAAETTKPPIEVPPTPAGPTETADEAKKEQA